MLSDLGNYTPLIPQEPKSNSIASSATNRLNLSRSISAILGPISVSSATRSNFGFPHFKHRSHAIGRPPILPPAIPGMDPSRLLFTTVDVFTSTRYAGNPLAIVLLPADVSLSQQQKQTIACEFNLSETVFLHDRAATENRWRVDIFTTFAELPFAGHPTIGSACFALAAQAKAEGVQSGMLSGAFDIKAGEVRLTYDVASGSASASIPHDVTIEGPTLSADDVTILQPSLSYYPGSSPIVSIVKGMTFGLICLKSLDELQKVRPGEDCKVEIPGSGFIGLYYYVLQDDGKVRTRMCAQQMEDAATGSAACTLGCYLAMTMGTKGSKNKYEITQGVEMGRKSIIGIDVTLTDAGEVQEVLLSGNAIEVMSGQLIIP